MAVLIIATDTAIMFYLFNSATILLRIFELKDFINLTGALSILEGAITKMIFS